MIKSFMEWLVVSSEDPSRISATIRGVIIANIGLIMFAIHYFNLPYTIDQIISLVGSITTIIGALLGIFGLVRKIYNTIFK